jgi:hypothetical protein
MGDITWIKIFSLLLLSLFILGLDPVIDILRSLLSRLIKAGIVHDG